MHRPKGAKHCTMPAGILRALLHFEVLILAPDVIENRPLCVQAGFLVHKGTAENEEDHGVRTICTALCGSVSRSLFGRGSESEPKSAHRKPGSMTSAQRCGRAKEPQDPEHTRGKQAREQRTRAREREILASAVRRKESATVIRGEYGLQ